MAKHKLFIDVDLKDVQIRSKDVVFMVYEDDEKFGELRLSKGAIVWRGRNDKIGRKMGWSKFDRLMQDQSRRAEKRRPGVRTTVRRKKRQS